MYSALYVSHYLYLSLSLILSCSPSPLLFSVHPLSPLLFSLPTPHCPLLFSVHPLSPLLFSLPTPHCPLLFSVHPLSPLLFSLPTPHCPLLFSVSTSQHTCYLKGKELGPACGQESRSRSKYQLTFLSLSRIAGAYMFRQSPNWYPNIMILVKPSILIDNPGNQSYLGLCTAWHRQTWYDINPTLTPEYHGLLPTFKVFKKIWSIRHLCEKRPSIVMHKSSYYEESNPAWTLATWWAT